VCDGDVRGEGGKRCAYTRDFFDGKKEWKGKEKNERRINRKTKPKPSVNQNETRNPENQRVPNQEAIT
jgi:hypothetical protein